MNNIITGFVHELQKVNCEARDTPLGDELTRIIYGRKSLCVWSSFVQISEISGQKK